MACPLCRVRKAKRGCPAVTQDICTVCCGTKRIVEIACPPECVYLTAAQRHPAAVVKRQQEQDVAVLLGALGQVSESQLQLFFLVHSFITRFVASHGALTDGDVAEAMAALATSHETASRGVLFEEAVTSPAGEALRRELKAFLGELGGRVGPRFDREVAPVLRGIERGARHDAPGIGSGPVDYLTLVARMLHERPPDAGQSGPRIILP